MTRRLLLGALLALLLAASAAAQTFPMMMKFGFDPPPASDNVLGFRYQLDGGGWVDNVLPPTNPACANYVGGAVGPCVPFSVPIPTAGAHTLQVLVYNLAGDSDPTTFTFNLPANKPGTPGKVRIIK